jgi:TRAP-type C4-dicarboxylate transport system permease small subunit
MTDNLAAALRRINSGLALLVGIVVLVTAGFVIVDITLRQFGHSFGGSDEISGYVMAAVASWGLSYALTELAHVRIDLVRQKLQTRGRAMLDIFAMSIAAGTVCIIAYQAWPVLEKTLVRGSRANTALETPLWIPQAVWFSGWVWFAISSCLLVLLAVATVLRGDFQNADAMIGARGEAEDGK